MKHPVAQQSDERIDQDPYQARLPSEPVTDAPPSGRAFGDRTVRLVAPGVPAPKIPPIRLIPRNLRKLAKLIPLGQPSLA